MKIMLFEEMEVYVFQDKVANATFWDWDKDIILAHAQGMMEYYLSIGRKVGMMFKNNVYYLYELAE